MYLPDKPCQPHHAQPPPAPLPTPSSLPQLDPLPLVLHPKPTTTKTATQANANTEPWPTATQMEAFEDDGLPSSKTLRNATHASQTSTQPSTMRLEPHSPTAMSHTMLAALTVSEWQTRTPTSQNATTDTSSTSHIAPQPPASHHKSAMSQMTPYTSTMPLPTPHEPTQWMATSPAVLRAHLTPAVST